MLTKRHTCIELYIFTQEVVTTCKRTVSVQERFDISSISSVLIYGNIHKTKQNDTIKQVSLKLKNTS